MDDQRFGVGVRAARVRRGLRQQDLADAAGVSRAKVSRIERGLLGELTLDNVRRVAAALRIRVEVLPRSAAADFERTLNARHARLAEAVVRWLQSIGRWTVRPEVSFSIFGERGVIDLLAWHAASRSLLVIELKTEIVDVGELLGTLGRKVRLAREAAAPLGWSPLVVGCAVIVAESVTNRRRVRDHAATLRAALPADGRALGRWLRSPAGTQLEVRAPGGTAPELRALTFLANAHQVSVGSGFATVRRVRVGRPGRNSAALSVAPGSRGAAGGTGGAIARARSV
jgi:transcriptional regulator with XRE-family HTH domain